MRIPLPLALTCFAVVTFPLSALAAAEAPAQPASPPAVVIERAPEGNPPQPGDDSAGLRTENKRLADAAAAEKKRADEAIARLNTINAGVERLMQEKATLEAKLAQARTTESALRDKLDAAEKAAAQPPTDYPAKLAEAQKKLAAAEQRQTVLETDNQLLKTASAEQVRLTAELEKMKQEKLARDAAAPMVSDLNGRIADLQSKLDTALRSYSLLEKENDQLKAAAPNQAATQSELDALRRDKAALEAKLAAAPSGKSAEQSARLAETENKLATALQSYSQLQAENDQLKAAAGNQAATQSELDTLRRDNAALEAKLAAAAAATPSPDVTGRLAETESKLSTVLRSYSLLQAENDRLKADAARDAQQAQASSAKASAEAAGQISALFDDLRQTKAQAASLAMDNSQLRTRLALVGSPPASLLASPVRPGTAAATTAATPAPVPEPAVPAGPRTHVVVAGDSLAKISRAYYGTSNRWDEILRANRDVIKDENVLPVGTTLKIP